MKVGCMECNHCKIYPGSYWDPDDFECLKANEVDEDTFVRVWEDGEQWEASSESVCPMFEQIVEEEYCL